ncbi:hypothetical protein ACO0QE_001760 [Hanseniaspora vineae]
MSGTPVQNVSRETLAQPDTDGSRAKNEEITAGNNHHTAFSSLKGIPNAKLNKINGWSANVAHNSDALSHDKSFTGAAYDQASDDENPEYVPHFFNLMDELREATASQCSENAVFVGTVFFGAFVFQGAFDSAVTSWYENHNKGKLWKDVKAQLNGGDGDDDDE